jgi:hypothetical protein
LLRPNPIRLLHAGTQILHVIQLDHGGVFRFTKEWEPHLGSRVVGAHRPWRNQIACRTMHHLLGHHQQHSVSNSATKISRQRAVDKKQRGASQSVTVLSTRVALREKRGDRPRETGRGASGIIFGFNSLKANLPSIALGLVWRVLGEGGLLGASRATRSPLLPRADLCGMFRR